MIEQNEPGAHPLESIVQKTKFPTVVDLPMAKGSLQDNSAPKQIGNPGQSGIALTTKLTLSGLQQAAMLIRGDLKILWQNDLARESLWFGAPIMHHEIGGPSVFQLVFNANFQSLVENWRQWAGFFLRHGLSMTSHGNLSAVIDTQNERCRHELRNLFTGLPDTDHDDTICDGCITRIQEGEETKIRVTHLDFTEGRLLVFSPDTSDPTEKQTKHAPREATEYTEPVELSLYFISAQLDDAARFQTEMLPQEYSRLVNLIWRKTTEIIEQFGGMVSQTNGSCLLGYFGPQGMPVDNPMGIIQCALELKAQITAIERQYKLRKNWLHRIALNLGLHFSNEFVCTISPGKRTGLAAFGNGSQISACLAAMGRNGEIWASKNFITKLSHDAQEHVYFGVYLSENHPRSLIENGFAHIKDLSHVPQHPLVAVDDFSTLVVTQIFDTQNRGGP